MWRRQLSWNPADRSWRAGAFFMIGSTCFALGSFPPYFQNLPGGVVGVTFFIGSIFFTSAGVTQLFDVAKDDLGMREGRPRFYQPGRMVWWAVVVQLVGMLFFNINTYRAMLDGLTIEETNRLVWAPDFFGSVAFLIASHLAWWDVCGRLWCYQRDKPDWWMAALNYVGSIFFMLSAFGAYTLPTTGDMVNVVWVNAGTFLGAVCFFAGAYLLLPPKSLIQEGMSA